MFDVDHFVASCTTAMTEDQPRLAIRDVLQQTMSDATAVADAFGAQTGGLTVLHEGIDLTVINVVWPPDMRIFPHEHRMWAAIGMYAGQEDNTFFRRDGDHAVESGGKTLTVGDVTLLGDDTIHSVHNPLRRYTAAIHVYGGDFLHEPRSQWDPEMLSEEPYDMQNALDEFERAEGAARDVTS